MAIKVEGGLYESITGQLFEIGRQLRQPSGYPFNPEKLQEYLQNAIEGRFGVSSFLLTLDGSYSASKLIKKGKYDWFNDDITDERFPIQKREPIEHKIELVEFDHDPSSEEVLAEFKERGLERPIYEDAFYYGIKYPEEQRKHPVVFLHEPVLNPDGRRNVLVLGGDDGERRLRLICFGYEWSRRCAFAGVRK